MKRTSTLALRNRVTSKEKECISSLLKRVSVYGSDLRWVGIGGMNRPDYYPCRGHKCFTSFCNSIFARCS